MPEAVRDRLPRLVPHTDDVLEKEMRRVRSAKSRRSARRTSQNSTRIRSFQTVVSTRAINGPNRLVLCKLRKKDTYFATGVLAEGPDSNYGISEYNKPDADPSLDSVKTTIQTGWYVDGTQHSKT